MNTHNKEALGMEKRVRALRVKMADEDMTFRQAGFNDAFSAYNSNY